MIRILNSEEIDVETYFSRILVELCICLKLSCLIIDVLI
jgi:hypothetical protein